MYVFDTFFNKIHIYWIRVRPQAKRVHLKTKLIFHIHIGLGLEYLLGIWLKVFFKNSEYELGLKSLLTSWPRIRMSFSTLANGWNIFLTIWWPKGWSHIPINIALLKFPTSLESQDQPLKCWGGSYASSVSCSIYVVEKDPSGLFC